LQYAALNRFDEAKAVYRQAMARKLEDSGLHANLYGIAFLQGDAAEMKSQIAWAADQPGAEDMLLSLDWTWRFFNQSEWRSSTSACSSMLGKVLDTANIVRDACQRQPL